MTSWCLISRTMRRIAIIDHRSLRLRATINWSPSSLCTRAIQYLVSWLRSILIWSFSHPIACCCPLLLSPVICTFLKSLSWAMLSVATIAALRCTNWCPRWCCVSARRASEEEPVVRLDSDWITLRRGVSGAMSCCFGKGEEDDNEKWKVLTNI